MKIKSSVNTILPKEEKNKEVTTILGDNKHNPIYKGLIRRTRTLFAKHTNHLKNLNISFDKNYLIFSPIIIFIFTLVFSLFYVSANLDKQANSNNVDPSYNVYTSKPKENLSYDVQVSTQDARAEKIERFLQKYNAPLAEHSDFIVEMADKYEIDWKLVAAIGYCEGNGGKKIPEGSYNTWGWSASEKDLSEKSGRYNLGSWTSAIETVSRGLKIGYIDQGLETPEEIMQKYAPPSVAKGGPWAKCVNQYMNEIDNIK